MASNERPNCIKLAIEGERLCRSGNYVDGIRHLEAAVELGTDDYNTLAAIYNHMGNAYIFLGNFDKALEYYQHDCMLARSADDLMGEAQAVCNISSTLKMIGRYEEAIQHCERHLEIEKVLSNKAGQAQALYNLGNIYHLRAKQKRSTKPTVPLGQHEPEVVADLELAIKLYNENLAIVKELDDRALIGKVYGSLGIAYYLLGNGAEAVKFHTERLAIAKEFGDKEAQRRALVNRGNSYVSVGEYRLATESYIESLSICRHLGDRVSEAQTCYCLGATYALLNDFERAIEYHTRHMQLARDLNDRRGMGRACWSLSNAHSSLGNYKQAMEYAEEQLALCTENNDKAGILMAENKLKDLETLVCKGDLETPIRARRLSMEKMHLLSLTPEQAKNAADARKNGTTEKRTVNSVQNNAGEASNNSGTERQSGGLQLAYRTYNGLHVGNPADPTHRPGNSGLANSGFFDLISRLQGSRMNDQRAEMREEELLQLNIGHPYNPEQAHDVVENGVQDGRPPEVNAAEQEENHERMNSMISMLVRSQSKRLNEQRVCMSELPATTGIMQANLQNQGDATSRNSNGHVGNPALELDDSFFDTLIRYQGSRLNDQRSVAPDLEDNFSTLTIPSEDFFSLIMRMQSSRIEDQRCQFDPDQQ